MGSRWVLVGRLLLSAVFLTSFAAKFHAPKELVATLALSELLPSGSENVASVILLAAELLTALLLLVRPTYRAGLVLSTALSSLFFGYALWRWHLDINAPCHCFGLLLKLEPWQSGLLTIAMTSCSMACLREVGLPFVPRPIARYRAQGGRP